MKISKEIREKIARIHKSITEFDEWVSNFLVKKIQDFRVDNVWVRKEKDKLCDALTPGEINGMLDAIIDTHISEAKGGTK